MKERAVLVTGANGFLGVHLVRELLRGGHQVRALVRPSSHLGAWKAVLNHPNLRLAVGDVRMESSVYAALRGTDRVYHLAANVQVDERERTEAIGINVEGTECVLSACRKAGTRRVVVTSSIFSLGATEQKVVMTEEQAFNVVDANVYARSKYKAEQLALGQSQVDVVVVNPGMLVGPYDDKPTPLGQMLLAYLAMPRALYLPSLPGGLNYVAVSDAATGHILAMERGRSFERYILGSQNLTHEQLLLVLCDLTGLAAPSGELDYAGARRLAWLEEWAARLSGRPARLSRKLIDNYYGSYLFVSSDKAKAELGYTPRPVFSALRDELAYFLGGPWLAPEQKARVRLRSQGGAHAAN